MLKERVKFWIVRTDYGDMVRFNTQKEAENHIKDQFQSWGENVENYEIIPVTRVLKPVVSVDISIEEVE